MWTPDDTWIPHPKETGFPEVAKICIASFLDQQPRTKAHACPRPKKYALSMEFTILAFTIVCITIFHVYLNPLPVELVMTKVGVT